MLCQKKGPASAQQQSFGRQCHTAPACHYDLSPSAAAGQSGECCPINMPRQVKFGQINVACRHNLKLRQVLYPAPQPRDKDSPTNSAATAFCPGLRSWTVDGSAGAAAPPIGRGRYSRRSAAAAPQPRGRPGAIAAARRET